MAYQLWYWPTIQGRGEFVRLPLEAAGIDYEDCGRTRGGEAIPENMKSWGPAAPFAPPYLVRNGVAIAQVANILLYLGEQHDLAPQDERGRLWLHQLQLTIADLVAEVHDVHHPVGVGDYYEDQKPEAARAAAQFRDARMPKFLSHFEAATQAHDGDWLTGQRWSYADCSLFQIVEGLRYMFPKRMKAIEPDYPGMIAIRDRVTKLPGIAAYLASDRRIPFNTQGIFRHYSELDAA